MDKLALGRRIYVARKERGLTSKDLAELCGINATYLGRSKTAQVRPVCRCLLPFANSCRFRLTICWLRILEHLTCSVQKIWR